MKSPLTALSLILGLLPLFGQSPPQLGVMETAFGHRCQVESIALAREAGFAGIQIHTGNLEEDGHLTLSDTQLQKDFAEAAKENKIEIVSLCAGSMNRLAIWKEGQDRQDGLTIITESLAACEALGCRTLLFPFFGPSNFQKSEEKLAGVTEFMREILPVAAQHQVTIGIESPITFERVQELFTRLDNPPQLKMYYDTGNMMRQGEDIYAAIAAHQPGQICEVHLKPEGSTVFGQDQTNLAQLAAALDSIAYEGWLIFEARGGVTKGEAALATQNREGMARLLELRQR